MLGALVVASGCVQSTRHSNTMIFGTNTTVGLKVGQNVNQVPEIMLAYDRQEAVIMPLVANTREKAGASNKLTPCDFTQTFTAGSNLTVHPCSLVATNGSAQDSYSVLASFGASFDGSSQSGGTVGAKGGLAQYFATGLAAQILALNGGASVVAVGEAAAKSAEHPPSAAAIASLTASPAQRALISLRISEYQKFVFGLHEKIDGTLAANLMARITTFESNVGASFPVASKCTSKDKCKEAVTRAYEDEYYSQKTLFDTELNNWVNP
ncbi:MAG: hypothetical protein V7679_03080 [Parasphingorhabdus sp.]